MLNAPRDRHAERDDDLVRGACTDHEWQVFRGCHRNLRATAVSPGSQIEFDDNCNRLFI